MELTTEHRRRHRRKKKQPNWIKRTVLIVVGLFVLAGAWLAVSGVVTVKNLTQAHQAAEQLQTAFASGDSAATEKARVKFASSSATAYFFSRDPLWAAASCLPWVGSNFAAISATSYSADLIAREGIPAIEELKNAVSPNALKPVDGTLNLAPLIAAQPAAQNTANAFAAADRQMSSISSSSLLPQLGAQFGQAQTQVHLLNSIMNTVNAVVQLAPSVLGQDGSRSYAIMVQNVAEARSTGGIAGALVLMETNMGHISLSQEVSSADFPLFDPPVMKLPIGTRSIFGDQPAQMIQDVNYTPDFELSGLLVQKMWNKQFGHNVNGVISIDPVALSYLLEATGPITLEDGQQLTSENALKFLLTDVYAKYGLPQEQDAFFAGVASSVFNAISSGAFDGEKLISALSRAGSEHRVFMWNSDPLEQSFIADSTLATLLPQSSPSQSGFGLYFNDQTGSKMDTYLDVKVETSVSYCRQDKRPVFSFEVAMTNTAPLDAADVLPKYVTGGGEFGTSPGTIRTQVLTYGPQNGAWLPVLKDGKATDSFVAVNGKYLANVLEEYLAPGESTHITLEFVGENSAPGNISLLTTPLPSLTVTDSTSQSCESTVE